MIDANQITSRLRMMSDAELQRFAEMHKQDPYMFPLAFNESNTRKQLRMKGHAQAQAPQPPVNQQALAAMQPQQLPEDQGIGALNPEMQFADGGLVAFAGGGGLGDYEYVPQIGDNGEEVFEYADGGVVRFQNRGGVPTPYDYPGWVSQMASGEGGSQEERMRAQLAAKRAGGAPTEEEAAEIAEARKTLRSIYQPVRAAAGKVGSFIGDIATAPYRGAMTGMDKYAALINAAAGKPVVPRAGTPGNRPEFEMFPSFKGAPTAAAPAAKTAPPPVPAPQAKGPGIEQLMPPEVLAAARRGESGAMLPPSGEPAGAMPRPTSTAADFSTTKDTEDFYAEKIKAEEEKASRRFEEYKKGRPGPETFAEEKALLAEDKAETEKQQRMNEGLAWLTFASNVIQPGKSALQSIVEGVSAGAGQYAKAQGDLKKAEKERKAGLAALARMERAEGRKDYDALESYKQQLQGNVDRMNAAAIDAIAKARNVDQQTALAIYMNAQDNATRLKMTQMQVDASRFVAGMRGGAAAKPIMTLEDFAKLPKNAVLSTAQLVAEYNKMLEAAGSPSADRVMPGPPPENALKPKM